MEGQASGFHREALAGRQAGRLAGMWHPCEVLLPLCKDAPPCVGVIWIWIWIWIALVLHFICCRCHPSRPPALPSARPPCGLRC
jgi:hypothetical protein